MTKSPIAPFSSAAAIVAARRQEACPLPSALQRRKVCAWLAAQDRIISLALEMTTGQLYS